MDNFEMKTFAIESNIDWDQMIEGEALSFSQALPSSQASQQSDYLRNLDLGFDVSEFDFLQNEDGCRDEVKQEPESLCEDVLDQLLYPGSEQSAQQLSPGVNLYPQMQVPEPAREQNITENFQSGPLISVLPDEIHEIPVDVYSVCTTDTEDAIPSPRSDFDEESIVGDVDSTTRDMEVSYTMIKPKSRSTRRKHDDLERAPSPLFTDDYLRRVGTKEFNKHVNELSISPEEVKRWKRRRRTLKNRGYAQNCRQRRVGRHQAADEENMRLRRELAEERSRAVRLRQRINILESTLAARGLQL